MVRFGYIHVLDYFLSHDPEQLQRQCRALLPIVASAWGRVNVLEWARDSAFKLEPDTAILEEAVDEASRHGQVAGTFQHPQQSCVALTSCVSPIKSWNFGSILAFHYVSLDHCCICAVLFLLSSSHRAEYTEKALASATVKRQLGSLEWWRKSGLPLKIGNVVSTQNPLLSCTFLRSCAGVIFPARLCLDGGFNRWASLRESPHNLLSE